MKYTRLTQLNGFCEKLGKTQEKDLISLGGYMPQPDSDFILAPQKVRYQVSLEPAHNILHTLMMLNVVDQYPGVSDWLIKIAAELSPERLHTNKLVTDGLHLAINPDRSYSSFPAYVDALEAKPAEALRDVLMTRLSDPEFSKKHNSDAVAPDRETLLSSVDAYLNFLRDCCGDGEVDLAIEAEGHALLNDPEAMQALIVSHFRWMWENVLAPDWERVLPELLDSVRAFQQVDLDKMEPLKAVQIVTGRDDLRAWAHKLEHADKVIFVPSAHLGPYVSKFEMGGTLRLGFGARLPEDTKVSSPALSRSEILVRMRALTDDIRLSIMALVKERVEVYAQEVMTELDLSQSAASRHLRQLTAVGFLTERRREGGKSYSLNFVRLNNTFFALEKFLGM